MPQSVNRAVIGSFALLAALAAAPALADVRSGVEAWSRGDYVAAVRAWEAPAAAGDADAMFNLAQAYRLGRGVPADLVRAEKLYAQAAKNGHLQAADTYGLMLFQNGRREAALPFINDAARRGDPRSQYLLGIAHFNGDGVPRDWVRAYALMTLANGAGLPQANAAIAQMDQHIPLAQRQQSAALAVQMRSEADATRARELAAAELGSGAPVANAGLAAAPSAIASSPRVPPSRTSSALSPSVEAARAAVAAASAATGTESPASAGASFAAKPAQAARPASAPRTPAPARVARADPPARAPAAAAPAPAGGAWRLQLGAFSVSGNAERLWSTLSARNELTGKQRLLIPAGRVTKLQAGGFASRAEADRACRALQGAGHDCLVTR